MATECDVVFWVGSWSRKRTLDKNWVNVPEVWALVNNDVSILVY